MVLQGYRFCFKEKECDTCQIERKMPRRAATRTEQAKKIPPKLYTIFPYKARPKFSGNDPNLDYSECGIYISKIECILQYCRAWLPDVSGLFI